MSFSGLPLAHFLALVYSLPSGLPSSFASALVSQLAFGLVWRDRVRRGSSGTWGRHFIPNQHT